MARLLVLDPDRLFPPDWEAADLARELTVGQVRRACKIDQNQPAVPAA